MQMFIFHAYAMRYASERLRDGRTFKFPAGPVSTVRELFLESQNLETTRDNSVQILADNRILRGINNGRKQITFGYIQSVFHKLAAEPIKMPCPLTPHSQTRLR